ncbi:Flap-structured DNA-binding and RNA-binding protein [Coemansia nantahalensis]|nr:Flap-structured DNA-binding and RNA-binding protein [Coemansia nantahalensis]
MARGPYAQAAAAAGAVPSYPMQYHQGYGAGHPPGMGAPVAAASLPSRAPFVHPATCTTPPVGEAAFMQSPAGALKPQAEVVDLMLVRDIPAWLRSLRLHKYTECFAGMDWTSVVSLSDEQLQEKGVTALGARRKMLKVFEAVLEDM